MTWKEFIHKCGLEIGRPEDWPQIVDDGPIKPFHVDRAYVALQAVLNFLPFQRLVGTYGISKSNATLQEMPDQYKKMEIPAQILTSRPDFGLESIEVEGRLFHPDQVSDYKSFFAVLGNPFQKGNVRFAFSPSAKCIYFSNLKEATSTAGINHFSNPAKPSLADIATTVWPLNDLDSQAALHVVSAHASLDHQDVEMFRAQQILTTFYNGSN